MAASRSRFSGGAASLEEVLAKHVTGASYLPPAPSKLKGDYVKKHATMLLKDLAAQQANLSFKKSVLEAAHCNIFEKRYSAWSLPESTAQEWSSTMTSRLRKVCRFTQQASLKDKPPKWYVELGLAHEGDVTEDGGDEENKEEEHQSDPDVVVHVEEEAVETATAAASKVVLRRPACASNFAYGWCKETMQAWRGRVEMSGSVAKVVDKTFAKLVAASGAKPTDAPVAVFDGGDVHVMSEFTVADLATLGVRQGAKLPSACEEIGKTRDGVPIRVTVKTDRNQLVLLIVGKAQKCQARVDLFADEEAARQFMKELAEIHIENNKWEKDDIYKSRTAALEKLGLVSAAMKRPAAAPAADEERAPKVAKQKKPSRKKAAKTKSKPAAAAPSDNDGDDDDDGEKASDELDDAALLTVAAMDFSPPGSGMLETALACARSDHA